MSGGISGAGKVAFVTGGSRGIGREVARGLLAAGATVLMAARNASEGEAAAAELAAAGPAFFLRFDAADDASIAAAAAHVAERFGRLDILVNNAGIAAGGLPSATSRAELEQVFAVNVFGVVATIAAFLPLLRAASAGRIVNVSSALASLAGRAAAAEPTGLAYALSKTALNGVTVHFAAELAGTPIRVNAVSPGHCRTAINGFTGPKSAAEGARFILAFALAGPDCPQGGFFEDGRPLPW